MSPTKLSVTCSSGELPQPSANRPSTAHRLDRFIVIVRTNTRALADPPNRPQLDAP